MDSNASMPVWHFPLKKHILMSMLPFSLLFVSVVILGPKLAFPRDRQEIRAAHRGTITGPDPPAS